MVRIIPVFNSLPIAHYNLQKCVTYMFKEPELIGVKSDNAL
jgi:hypothetical protein